jgi:hypothetical protein
MTMTLREFRAALMTALNRHLPQAEVTLTESRGVVLTGRAKLDADTFIAVYFNALTGKTSYALVRQDRRLAGYDNYKFWHYHPPGEANRHEPCAEPTPEEAIAELTRVSDFVLQVLTAEEESPDE